LMKYSDSLMNMMVQPRKGTHLYFGDMVVNVGQEKKPFFAEALCLTLCA